MICMHKTEGITKVTSFGTKVTVHEGILPGLMVIMSGTHGVEGHGSELVQDVIETNFQQDKGSGSPTLFVVRARGRRGSPAVAERYHHQCDGSPV